VSNIVSSDKVYSRIVNISPIWVAQSFFDFDGRWRFFGRRATIPKRCFPGTPSYSMELMVLVTDAIGSLHFSFYKLTEMDATARLDTLRLHVRFHDQEVET
jgi:hypothetical protein